jgi:hypothetical protein
MLTIRREVVRPAGLVGGPGAGVVARFAVPAVLAIGWLAVVLTHRRMPYPSDQLHYMEAAAHFPQPTSDLTHQMTRFGLTAPTRLVMAVFGYSEASYYFVPVLGGLLLLLGTYAIGAMLFSRMVGAAAAVVLAGYTPVFYDFTELLPDVLATGILTVAVAIAVAVRQGRLPARPHVLLLIGLLLGWSYLVREFAVFVWPLPLVLLWPRLKEAGPLLRGLLWVAAPVAVLGLAETLVCWAVYEDPLARVRAVTGHADSANADRVADTFRDKPRRVYLARLWAVLNGNEHNYYAQQWVMRPLLAAACIGVLVRYRRLWVFGLWMALLWVPLTLLGGAVDPSRPSLRLQLIRYWFPIFPAIVLGGVAALWLLLRHLHGYGEKRAPAPLARATALVPVVAVVSLACASAVLGVRGWSADPAAFRGAGNMSDLRGWLSRDGDLARRVWADSATAAVLEVYRQGPAGGRRWAADVRSLGLDRAGPAPGDVVVFFDTEKGEICGHCRLRTGEALGTPIQPAPNWRQVYVNAEGVVRVYEVGPPV